MKPGTIRALLGLLVLVAFHMREALFEGRVYFERDLHLQWFGQMESFARAVASGAWPLWDPFVGFGQPLLGNANTQLFYPTTWLNLLIAPGSYYTLYLFLHLLMAGCGVFRLSERWGVSAGGSFVAAALWICGGPLLSLGNTWNHLAGAALVPWLVLAADRVMVEGGSRPLLVFAAAFALPVLAGSPDFLLLCAPLVMGLALARPGASGERRSRLVRLTLGALLGVGLCSAQLLPSLDLVAHSSRADLPAYVRGHWSVHPLVALQSLVPLAWNSLSLSAEDRALFFESREPYLFSLYVGLPALALAALGAAREGHRFRALLLGVAGLSLLLAFGRHTPLYAAATALLPPLRMIRYPAKAMVMVSLGVALLAGAGFDAWQKRARSRGVALGLLVTAALGAAITAWALAQATVASPAPKALLRVTALALALALFAGLRARGPDWTRGTAVAAAALALGDLASYHRDLNPTAPSDFYRLRPPILAGIDKGDTGRLLVFDYTMAPGLAQRYLHRDQPYLLAPTVSRESWRGAMRQRLYPIAPITGGFQVFSSLGRDFLGIQPEPLMRLNNFATASMGAPGWERLLAGVGVSRLITLHEGALAGTAATVRAPGPFFEDLRLYEIPGARPRCAVVDGIRNGDDPALLGGVDFDPAREVLLPEGQPRRSDPSFEAACRIKELRADRVHLESQASAPGHVVLLDAWEGGWVATLDGEPVPVLRANVAFRAIAVPAGRHSIAFFYRPWSVPIGLAISLLSFLAAAVFWVKAGSAPRAAQGSLRPESGSDLPQ